MMISVFGIGYVGTTSAACLANLGHKVICIDIDHRKVELLDQGKSPVKEKHLASLIRKARRENLSATTDYMEAIKKTDLSLITVGTPIGNDGMIDLRSVFNVFQEIGKGLRHKNGYHTIVLRSTVPPGTTMKGFKIVEDVSGKKLGSDFGGCMIPEFFREGSMVEDFYNPPFVVIGEYDRISGDVAVKLYKGIDSELIRTYLEVAELTKYVCNVFHGLKIAFANEIGRFSRSIGIDARKVMDIFVKDHKLNLSSCYLKPGFPFGGSCLPKDLEGLIVMSEKLGVKMPILKSIMSSNNLHIDYAINRIKNMKGNRVGILGITFKGNTDDMRRSPAIALMRRLLDLGYEVFFYDDVNLQDLIGSNRKYVETLPFNLQKLKVSSLSNLVELSDIIVITHRNEKIKKVTRFLSNNQFLFDAAGLFNSPPKIENYEGICW